MTMTEPVEETTPLPPPARHRVWRSEHRMLTGTAGGLADAWGIDPAWLRMAFVVLVLFRGLGAWLYVLAWLLLPTGPDAPPHRALRRVVATAAGFGLLVLLWNGLASSRAGISNTAVVVVLAGAALALWRSPARSPSRSPSPSPSPSPDPRPLGASAPLPFGPPRPPRPRRAPRPVRPPSTIGRLALAAALMLVATTGAVTNGRPGPLKVAFGLAAVICGVGMVAAGFGRRARYLVIPAVVALGGSVVAASVDGLGVRVGLYGDGDYYVPASTSALPARIDKRAGDVRLDVALLEADTSTVIRIGVGDLVLATNPDRVRVELHARIGIGSIDSSDGRVDRGYRREVTTVFGSPTAAHVVHVDAAIGLGTVRVETLGLGGARIAKQPAFAKPGASLATMPPGVAVIEADGTRIYDNGIRVTPDGSIELPDGTALRPDGSRTYGQGAQVFPDGHAVLADGTVINADGSVPIASSSGPLLLRPGG